MVFMPSKATILADNIVRLPDVDSGPSQNLIRVHNSNMKPFRRRMPVVIHNIDSGKWTIRYIVGGNSLKGLTKTSVGLDYDAYVELGIDRAKKPYNLVVKKANIAQVNIWLMRSPDAIAKYGAIWGVVGTVLGLVSFFV
ncbi:hypothetical protein HUO09_17880 [Vibrio sp. Y2-5]|uniref:hypothetical protein n=1 Tax=Vibrio sp. Y2-5 TaxID=2743977 RepID=UPI0016606827|nr:hypothetical protein [Vibrio sp. Y2-5]MBD0788229.1 hypothetical protein [Vibrio sp. Y2-5]